MRILTASDTALLVQAEDLEEAMRYNLAWAQVPGVTELVPGASTVLVRFDPARTTATELATALRTAPVQEITGQSLREVSIPVDYDGEDLTEVAQLLDVSVEALIARHVAAEWRVAFSGFAPGFGYAKSSDALFDVPRRSSPRTRVPAGAVGLAGPFTGMYPRESPGGWQLIGHTAAVLWDIDRDPPALAAPGTVLRFQRQERSGVVLRSVNDDEVARADQESTPDSGGAATAAGTTDPGTTNAGTTNAAVTGTVKPQRGTGAGAGADVGHGPAAWLQILQPGLQMVLQDAGRPGHAALGVSSSGAADRTAMRQANRAVGNAPDAPVIECVGAVSLEYGGAPGVLAVTGAEGPVAVTSADGERLEVVAGVPFAVEDGDRVSTGFPSRGLRYVIAARGSLDVAPALGSAASDTLAGLGPAALEPGDRLGVKHPRLAPHSVDPHPGDRDLPAAGDVVELQITLGPRDDWFTDRALETLTGQEWEVTPRSDRVGLRLHGERPLERATSGELPSEGAVTGAIQVPTDGQPVLFLPDHPLTGGYPIIGAVTDDHLDLAGQLPPGARIRFRVSQPDGE